VNEFSELIVVQDGVMKWAGDLSRFFMRHVFEAINVVEYSFNISSLTFMVCSVAQIVFLLFVLGLLSCCVMGSFGHL